MNFKSNGYSLEKKEPKPTETAAPTPAPTASSAVDSPASPKTNTQENAKEKDKDAVAPSVPPHVPPPDKTEYLFKWQSEDGTYVFTDNPLRLAEEKNVRNTLKNIGTSPKERRRAATTNPPTHSRLQKKVNIKRAMDVAKTSVDPESIRIGNDAPRQTSITEDQPRDFEECMGAILIKNAQPKSVQEIMELFESAERSCAPYATPR